MLATEAIHTARNSRLTEGNSTVISSNFFSDLISGFGVSERVLTTVVLDSDLSETVLGCCVLQEMMLTKKLRPSNKSLKFLICINESTIFEDKKYLNLF